MVVHLVEKLQNKRKFEINLKILFHVDNQAEIESGIENVHKSFIIQWAYCKRQLHQMK